MVHMSAVLISLVTVRIVLCNTTPAEPSSEDAAEETQHAICKIITQEIQTSANATVKRQLKGVCTTRQIERKFKQLEKKLLSELDQIKSLLTGERPVTVKTNHNYDYFTYDEKSSDGQRFDYGNIVTLNEQVTQVKSLSRTEVTKLNDTIFTLKGEKVYMYYWEIPQIRSILRKNGIHIRSPDLYVMGHQLCIQLYPHHMDKNYVGIQLRPSSNFWKKHRFTVLDQFDSSKDIRSQRLGGVISYESVYKVPYEKLEERNYMYNDTVIIKLTIYLDS